MRTPAYLVLIAAFAAACSSKPKATETTPPGDAKTAAETTTTTTKVQIEAKDVKPSHDLTCTKGKDSRTLAVRTKDKGCELAYTKNGQEAVVASGKAGTAHCEATAEKISGKLKGAGYDCK